MLWAGLASMVYGPSVHRSTDLGESWTQIEHGPSYAANAGRTLERIWTVRPGHPSKPKELWAGGLCCHTLLNDPSNAERMWAGISAVGCFRTEDGGSSWTVHNNGIPIVAEDPEHEDIGCCVHKMVLDPENSGRLYQQNHLGVFRSDDAGDLWERIENGVPSSFGFPMVVDPGDSSTLFIVPQESDEYRFPVDGRLTVYRSRDAGDSWEAMQCLLPRISSVTAAVID